MGVCNDGRLLAVLFLCFLWPLNVYGKDCSQWQLSQRINGQQLWQDLSVLSADEMQGRKAGNNQLSRDYIASRFQQIGLLPFSDTYLQTFNYKRSGELNIGVNVVGMVPSALGLQKYIVITAHYDHLGIRGRHIYNGADDNASGVAALLALAQVAKQTPLNYGLIFVATDAEETGLYGAKAFVDDSPVPLEQIRLSLNLDMIAYSGQRKRLYLASAKADKGLKPIVEYAVEHASVCLVAGHNGVTRNYNNTGKIDWRASSDHAVFKRAEISYLFFSVNDHRYYHTENDTIDNINPTFYQAVVESILTTLAFAAESL
ncbi:M28 family peptidase [Alteromonadaceae bacterium BrNp21-10]|nr:M28 family peptidase [Alteromonadaceae bacterium BrNp21-10]